MTFLKGYKTYMITPTLNRLTCDKVIIQMLIVLIEKNTTYLMRLYFNFAAKLLDEKSLDGNTCEEYCVKSFP